MAKVEVIRRENPKPPVSEVVIRLTPEEAVFLSNLVGKQVAGDHGPNGSIHRAFRAAGVDYYTQTVEELNRSEAGVS